MSRLSRSYSSGATPAPRNKASVNASSETTASRPQASSTLLAPYTHLIRWKLEKTCRDKQKYQILLAHRGDDAQLILDGIQYVLKSSSLSGSPDAIILKAMTRLAAKAGLYPRCFQISNLVLLGNRASNWGGYGLVWRAALNGQIVGVKILREYKPDDPHHVLKRLLREGLTWAHLSYHRNVVPFYGIYIGEGRFGLVSAWMDNGNVMEYLARNPSAPRMNLVYDITCGIQHLHDFNIVHGDIKGTNILVNSSGRACIADFGLTNIFDDNIPKWSSVASGSSMARGTSRWRAPELILQEMITDKTPPNTLSSDIYSWACTVYEILTGRVPFFEIRSSRHLDWKKSNTHDFFPTRLSSAEAKWKFTNGLWKLLEDCWRSNVTQRPDIHEVLQQLERLMDFSESAGDTKDSPTNDSYSGVDSSHLWTGFSCSDEDILPSDEELRKVISMIPI